jgi:hypothetical protein
MIKPNELAFWAVGKSIDTAQLAIRLNNDEPILMSAADAWAIAQALQSEVQAIRPPEHPPRKVAHSSGGRSNARDGKKAERAARLRRSA